MTTESKNNGVQNSMHQRSRRRITYGSIKSVSSYVLPLGVMRSDEEMTGQPLILGIPFRWYYLVTDNNCGCGGSDGGKSAKHKTFFHHHVHLTYTDSDKKVDSSTVIHPDSVTRPDGIIHRIERLLIPQSVQDDFNRRRNLQQTSAVKPEGAPAVDPRTHRLKKLAPPTPSGSPPVLPIYDAMAPGPSLAPAAAPGPDGPHLKFDGESQVEDFIHTLLHYGRYNELADILANLTSLASEMGKLVSTGYVLTVLAPNDDAMAKLMTDQLSEPGALEQIIYYHLIPEYQTEESMYNVVRRFGKIKYDTLRVPHKVVAKEADGSVKFGQGDESAYLFNPDIYIDGRISIEGIDGVLFPIEEKTKSVQHSSTTTTTTTKAIVKPKRGGS
ncbi:fasciclin-like arabinogalactan protein 16 [Macadamia integrifolia]|uniref:fasciclin-like arabinogalactan protein 16 n=1 Tax=Macadamia integrifolia TaxID=60698 RepID=UPI001C4F138B|nr:fasciclin-like arabinogalactan protein 16 [Macadamia integrifolia]